MGKGSNDPILNKLMPHSGIIYMPNVLEIARGQKCRDQAELLACENLRKTCVSLIVQIDLLRDRLFQARQIIEAKIKSYEDEL
jgi:hypothetical protein